LFTLQRLRHFKGFGVHLKLVSLQHKPSLCWIALSVFNITLWWSSKAHVLLKLMIQCYYRRIWVPREKALTVSHARNRGNIISDKCGMKIWSLVWKKHTLTTVKPLQVLYFFLFKFPCKRVVLILSILAWFDNNNIKFSQSRCLICVGICMVSPDLLHCIAFPVYSISFFI
jgi:hypothetical protein